VVTLDTIKVITSHWQRQISILPPLKVYTILTIASPLYGCETRGYKETKASRDGVHETHSRIQFIRPYKKCRYYRRI